MTVYTPGVVVEVGDLDSPGFQELPSLILIHCDREAAKLAARLLYRGIDLGRILRLALIQEGLE